MFPKVARTRPLRHERRRPQIEPPNRGAHSSARLERIPDKDEVPGSNPGAPIWGVRRPPP